VDAPAAAAAAAAAAPAADGSIVGGDVLVEKRRD
jgi:hypothetical protein